MLWTQQGGGGDTISFRSLWELAKQVVYSISTVCPRANDGNGEVGKGFSEECLVSYASCIGSSSSSSKRCIDAVAKGFGVDSF